jgi:hypothetical protein
MDIIPNGETAAQGVLITARTVFQNADGSEIERTMFTRDAAVMVVGTVGANNSRTAGIVRALSYIE